MNRTRHVAIATALLAIVALAGCRRQEAPPAAAAAAPMPGKTTPPPTTVSAPATIATPAQSAMTVTGVDLGNAIGTDNRVVAPMTEFARTDAIHAVVASDGDRAGMLGAKWSYQDGQVVHTEEKSVAAGPQLTGFGIRKPDGWPAGTYRLDVAVDGTVVQSRDFTVK